MREITKKIIDINNELEDVLSELVKAYKSENVPRKRLALDRTIRHILKACAEVYQSVLILTTEFIEEVMEK